MYGRVKLRTALLERFRNNAHDCTLLRSTLRHLVWAAENHDEYSKAKTKNNKQPLSRLRLLKDIKRLEDEIRVSEEQFGGVIIHERAWHLRIVC